MQGSKREILFAALATVLLGSVSNLVHAQAPASTSASPSPSPSPSSRPAAPSGPSKATSLYSLLTLTTTSTSTVTLPPGTPLPSGAGPLRSDATSEYLTGLVRTLTLSVYEGIASPSSSSANVSSTTSGATASPTGQPQETQQQQPALPLDTHIDPAFGVLGVWLIASGAVMAFWGVKSRWTTVFISG